MSRNDLQRRCERLLRDADVPDPFDVDEFCARLAASRGRPLRLVPLPPGSGPAMPCGLWVATRDEDLIHVEPDTSPLHRGHIVLHELGHIVCHHPPAAVQAAAFARLLPDLDPDLVERMLGRTSYTDPQEQEAEMVASLLLARRGRHMPAAPTPEGTDGEVAQVLGRLSRVLGSVEG
jgi:IrrE N-terminal-like domain